jgi:S1-C subfamily serine protease
MVLDQRQSFGDREFKVVRLLPHDKIDVALVEFESELPPLPGLAFRDPVVAEKVYNLGYPRIPLSREPALVMQRGEITSSRIKTFSCEEVFLYSAIARPGNSGGPVIAANGHVVGLVTEELSEEASKSGMPFHAGVGTSEILRAILELEASVQLPVEAYE